MNDRLCAIHCTALDADGFRLLADGGATMVWSPLSNYLLYGETADIAAAKASGVPMSLGSDWAPSGSKNLLGELKVAWLASREHGDVFTPRELVEMITSNPARALKWDGLLGSVEPGKLADLVVVDGRDDDPYEQLVGARESSITLVVIGGVPRLGQARFMGRFWDVALDGVEWIDEVRVGRSVRRLYLEHDADLLDGLALSAAMDRCATRWRGCPSWPEDVDSAVVASTGAGVVAGGVPVDGDTFRVVPDFEDEDRTRLIEAMGFAAASQPYSFWVTEPMTLDPLTVVDDRAHLDQLVRARNVPEFVRRDLPGLYGETRPVPDSASFLRDADVDPQLLSTTTDLPTVLAASGRLGLDDRKQQYVLVVEEDLQRWRTYCCKKLLHLEEQFQHALDGRVVLERVKVGEPRQRREPLVPLRVVLHRARPQRVEVGVDRHVPRGEVREVADEVDLADFRQWRRRVREVFRRNQLAEWCGGHVRRRQPVASPPGLREFEDEFGGLGVVHSRCDLAKFSARTGDYALRMSRIAATSPSISAFVRFSVTATVMQSANCGIPPAERQAGVVARGAELREQRSARRRAPAA